MVYSDEDKNEIISQYLEKKISVREHADKNNLSRSAIYKWLQKNKTEPTKKYIDLSNCYNAFINIFKINNLISRPDKPLEEY